MCVPTLVCNKYGLTAMMEAADLQRPETVRVLLEWGADKNVRNQVGCVLFAKCVP